MKKYGIMACVLVAMSSALVACGDKPEAEPAESAVAAVESDHTDSLEKSAESAENAPQPAAMEMVIIPSTDDKLTVDRFKSLGEKYYLSFEDEAGMTKVNNQDYPIYTTYGSRYPSEEKEYIDASLVVFEDDAVARSAYDVSVENLSGEPEDLTMLAKELEDGSLALDVLIEDEVYTVMIQRGNAILMIESIPENAQEIKDFLLDMDIDLSKAK